MSGRYCDGTVSQNTVASSSVNALLWPPTLVMRARMLVGPDVLRARHQVLEQVREACASGLFIFRTHVIPHLPDARSASSGLRCRPPVKPFGRVFIV